MPDFKESRLLFEKFTKSDSAIWPVVTDEIKDKDDTEEYPEDLDLSDDLGDVIELEEDEMTEADESKIYTMGINYDDGIETEEEYEDVEF